MRLLLLFAFPREVREVLRSAGRRERIDGFPFTAFRILHPSHNLIAADTGLGVENSARVCRHLVRLERPDAVLSLGYCGALSPEASVGDLIWGTDVCLIDGQTIKTLTLREDRGLLEKLSLSLPLRAGTILTMRYWMKKGEIAKFVTPSMSLPVCDMETFATAWLCSQENLPFYALRAVSDGAGTDLAFDPWKVCDNKGTYRIARALRFFLTRPRLLSHAMELRRNSRMASRRLDMAVNSLLQIL
ncbi:MAG TPA: hypothetical protein VGJ94_15415 [Syntrophorhabdaceae bacterium]|jgi:nucleoside phosphorylase